MRIVRERKVNEGDEKKKGEGTSQLEYKSEYPIRNKEKLILNHKTFQNKTLFAQKKIAFENRNL